MGTLNDFLFARRARRARSGSFGHRPLLFPALMMLLSLGLLSPQSALSQTPYRGDFFDVYQEITRQLATQYRMVCNRRLHVLLVLDVSRSTQQNGMEIRFGQIWAKMWDNFLRDGDLVTLLPFGSNALPISGPFKKSEKSGFDSAVAQAKKETAQDTGTALYTVQQSALTKAKRIAETDRDRAVLVLMFTDLDGPNVTANALNQENRVRDTVIPELMKDFSVGSPQKEPVQPRPAPTPGQATPGQSEASPPPSLPLMHKKFYSVISDDRRGAAPIWLHSTIEAKWRQKREQTVARKIESRPSEPPPPPEPQPDRRPVIRLLGLLIGLLGFAFLPFLRFRVKVIPSGVAPIGDTDKKVSAYGKVTVSACNTADTPEPRDLWLPLPYSSPTPEPLITIQGLKPGSCVVEKIGGHMLTPDGQAASTVDIPYGESETIRVGIRPNELYPLQIVPGSWMEGKLIPLLMTMLFFLFGFIVLVIGLAMKAPEQPIAPEPEPAITDVCRAPGSNLMESGAVSLTQIQSSSEKRA
jgi:hypothetical protein